MKGQMMRFVMLPSGKMIYDHSSKMNRRGTYVCPGEGCIERLPKAKGLRKPSKSDENREVIKETIDLITLEIDRLIKVCSKMGFCRFDLSDSFSQDDMLICGPNASRESEELIRKAEEKGNRYFRDIKSPIEIFGELVLVKGSWPLLKKLVRNLEIYKRLSTRGVTI